MSDSDRIEDEAASDRRSGPEPDLDAELRRLEAASRSREAELLQLAEQVPAAVSRRATLRAMFADLGGVFRRRRS